MTIQPQHLLIIETTPTPFVDWDTVFASIFFTIINTHQDHDWLTTLHTSTPTVMLIVGTSDGGEGLPICRLIVEQDIDIPAIYMSDSGAEIAAAHELGVASSIYIDPDQQFLTFLPALINSTFEHIKKFKSFRRAVNTDLLQRNLTLALLQESVLDIIDAARDTS